MTREWIGELGGQGVCDGSGLRTNRSSTERMRLDWSDSLKRSSGYRYYLSIPEDLSTLSSSGCCLFCALASRLPRLEMASRRSMLGKSGGSG